MSLVLKSRKCDRAHWTFDGAFYCGKNKFKNILIHLNFSIKKAGPHLWKGNTTEAAFALKFNIFLPVPPTLCPPNNITSLFASHSHTFIFASHSTSFAYLRTYFHKKLLRACRLLAPATAETERNEWITVDKGSGELGDRMEQRSIGSFIQSIPAPDDG